MSAIRSLQKIKSFLGMYMWYLSGEESEDSVFLLRCSMARRETISGTGDPGQEEESEEEEEEGGVSSE